MHLGRMRTPLALLVVTVVALGSFQLGHRAGAAGAEPGSAADPLVSKSYVEQYVQTYVGQYVRSNVQGLVDESVSRAVGGNVSDLVNKAVAAAVPGEVARQVSQTLAAALPAQMAMAVPRYVEPHLQFQVVTVPRGALLTAGASAQLVLRSGQATAVASAAGGLADLTAGRDLSQGERVPANHLLLVPRDDGRGLLATTDVIVLVRGTFSIQSP